MEPEHRSGVHSRCILGAPLAPGCSLSFSRGPCYCCGALYPCRHPCFDCDFGHDHSPCPCFAHVYPYAVRGSDSDLYLSPRYALYPDPVGGHLPCACCPLHIALACHLHHPGGFAVRLSGCARQPNARCPARYRSTMRYDCGYERACAGASCASSLSYACASCSLTVLQHGVQPLRGFA